jgi:hypothetical protein
MRLIVRPDLWGMHLPHLRQYFKVAKRTWHGRSEAKAQRSLPIWAFMISSIRVHSHSFAVKSSFFKASALRAASPYRGARSVPQDA